MVMEIIQTVPELDMVVDAFLKTGFQFMQSATLGLDTVEGKTTKPPAHSEIYYIFNTIKRSSAIPTGLTELRYAQ